MKYPFLIAALSISTLCFAQKQTITFIKTDGQKTNNRDSALLVRTITEPEPGSNYYSFTENFVTGEPLRTGKTQRADEIVIDSVCTVFYPSGKKLLYAVYQNSRPKTETTYFNNGVIYTVKEYNYIADPNQPEKYTTESRVITCNDSTGKALVTQGNGFFISYNPAIKNAASAPLVKLYGKLSDVSEQGNVKQGRKDSIWKGKDTIDAFEYTATYQNGKLISGQSVDKKGHKYNYTQQNVTAQFRGGMDGFYNFLGANIMYPSSARTNKVQGNVIVTFTIEKDGSLSDIKPLNFLSKDINNETIRVLKTCPKWFPGKLYGIPVKQQFTVPINYTLGDSK